MRTERRYQHGTIVFAMLLAWCMSSDGTRKSSSYLNARVGSSETVRMSIDPTGRLEWYDKRREIKRLETTGDILLAQEELALFLQNPQRIPTGILAELHIHNGKLLSTLGYHDSARQSFIEALDLGTQSDHPYIALAHLEVCLGNLNGAVEHLQHALFVNSSSALALHDLGSIYFLLGDVVSANFYFEAASRKPSSEWNEGGNGVLLLPLDVWLSDHVLGILQPADAPLDPKSAVRIRKLLALSKKERAKVESNALFLSASAMHAQGMVEEALTS